MTGFAAPVPCFSNVRIARPFQFQVQNPDSDGVCSFFSVCWHPVRQDAIVTFHVLPRTAAERDVRAVAADAVTIEDLVVGLSRSGFKAEADTVRSMVTGGIGGGSGGGEGATAPPAPPAPPAPAPAPAVGETHDAGAGAGAGAGPDAGTGTDA